MKKRWSKAVGALIENCAVDAFLADVIEISKKHGLSIRHEDEHGAFVVSAYNEFSSSWLLDALDGTTEKGPA